MKRALRISAAAAMAAVALAACGSDDATAGMDMSSSSPSATSSSEPSAVGTPAEGENNDADVMFAQMMIPHHAQAIEMSDLVLAKDGVDQQVLDLAQQIKDAQGPEIERMTGWLQGWGAEVPDTSMGSMGGMGMGGMDGGMMSEEDMQALTDAEGPTASRLFLEQMVKHHTSAIAMAQTELSEGQNPEALELAQTIVDTQQEEITTMQELLATL